ncbi:hypothetical protein BVG19_g5486 [[Candida] boidinii]|nr:hypothetical protein BVG19_g5486 [[Candida] boidinii]OWB53946.1 succinate-semialdehyde dehydrogenase [NAD(P)+] activity protein [[Candida] boidinii]OWB82293.1 succinate-semialdehyde dehydrogenase [NAD(P)+] activity protein [[Candida] boidinii]
MLRYTTRKLTGIRSLSTISLKNPELLKTGSFINGQWLTNDETFEVSNPANQEKLADVTNTSIHGVNAAIESSVESFKYLKDTTPRIRSQLLLNFYKLMMDNADDLAKLITLENGKPLADSLGEVKYSAGFLQWFAEEAPRIYGDTIPSANPNNRILTFKQPVGVVGILTPWNFPSAMITRKFGAAFAAGCTSIVKPACETPLSALALAHLSKEAGIPDGCFNVVPVDSEKTKIVGEMFCSDKRINKISFTGSTNIGKILMSQSASSLKRISFELGGNAPFIVFEDADIDKAVQGAIASKFRSSGQTCICANRLYVHEKVYEEFSSKFATAVGKLTLGPGLDLSVTHGPLIHEKALNKVKEHITDAVSKGAKILAGGNAVPELGPFFHELTVLGDVTQDMKIAHEETFGPIAPLIKFSTDEQVIEMANDTDVGLAGYFFSQDYSKVFKIGEALNVGMVGCNTGAISEASMPFGGVKESGFGREGSKYSIQEYTNIKTIVVGL